MEIQLLSELESETEVKVNGRIFRNNLKKADGKVYSIGLVTRELGDNAEKYATNKNGPKRLMHNQITEGMVELISRKIMEEILGKDIAREKIDMSRYLPHTKVAQCIMNAYGEDDVISTFLTNSSDLLLELENRRIGNRDALHYMSDFINDQMYYGLIPEYSPRTKLFSKMPADIIRIFGITKDKQKDFQHEWSRAEDDGDIIDKLDSIVFHFSTKSLSDEERLIYNNYKNSYIDLVSGEKELYGMLEALLMDERATMLVPESIRDLASDFLVMQEKENVIDAFNELDSRDLKNEKENEVRK